MGRLEGKVAIVTGGASGIGLAVAEAFAKEGARVCVADVSQQRSDQAAEQVGRGAFGCRVDVTERASIEALVERTLEVAGGLDVLVNSAGVFGMESFVDISEAEFDRIFAVNTRGLVFMSQAAARRMIERGRGGAIINVASAAGRRPTPSAGVYSASKAAAISFTQVAALELMPHGIRVNAIAPGGVLTPMRDQVAADFAKAFGTSLDGAEAMQIAAAAAGRMSTPEEQAAAVVFLACAESAYIVGQTINIDGGTLLN